ncbi:rod-determining factor RdfA [Natrinema sp. 74]|uniref:rod-determining factor RdfA n=1 Tax=Natrinema sp. 74 TaxID=3384159 RepID=UPI0038D4E879
MGCKVDRLTDRYDLTPPRARDASLDEYLERRWTGADDRDPEGYKSLTEWFNKRLLSRIYEANGRDAMAAHLDREYELIVDGDGVERDELAADMATDGLDIDEVGSELISWSTMRHHLKGCLEAEKETPSASTDWERNTVEMAKEKTAEKARSVLSSLTSKDRLPEAERADIDVQVKLSCPECSVRVPFEDAVERGYVCETHFENRSSESVLEQTQNRLSVIAIPYSIVEASQTLLLEDPYLFEAVSMAGI